MKKIMFCGLIAVLAFAVMDTIFLIKHPAGYSIAQAQNTCVQVEPSCVIRQGPSASSESVVMCQANELVMGGGISTGQNGGRDDTESYPLPGPGNSPRGGGWHAKAYDTVQAYAICCRWN